MGLNGFDYEWTGLSLEERESGDQAPFFYALSLLIVFLCLAALYESWSIPFSVLLVVPLGYCRSIIAHLRGHDLVQKPEPIQQHLLPSGNYCRDWFICQKRDFDCRICQRATRKR